MRKICVILTGGTIGSARRGAFLDTDEKTGETLPERYRRKYGKDTAFDVCRPIDRLSENMTKKDLTTLADRLREKIGGGYDGIVITHGTDTLSFTAPLFSLLFCDVRLPVVFVSALYPLEDERSNGLDNFAAAVDFIGEIISLQHDFLSDVQKDHGDSRVLADRQSILLGDVGVLEQTVKGKFCVGLGFPPGAGGALPLLLEVTSKTTAPDRMPTAMTSCTHHMVPTP